MKETPVYDAMKMDATLKKFDKEWKALVRTAERSFHQIMPTWWIELNGPRRSNKAIDIIVAQQRQDSRNRRITFSEAERLQQES